MHFSVLMVPKPHNRELELENTFEVDVTTRTDRKFSFFKFLIDFGLVL